MPPADPTPAPPLRWTRTPPTEAGWYWCRAEDEIGIIHLWRDTDGVVVVGETGATVDGLTMWNCEWAGPIPAPEEV